MFADYHIHTNHSPDSIVHIGAYINRAMELGIDELCFTNHYDLDYPKAEPIDIDEYEKDFGLAKELYGNKIDFKFGMEFGVQSFNTQKFEKIFHKYDFDFIILSCHVVDRLELWNGEYQENRTQKEFNEGYYNELLKVVQNYKDYSVLGHLDLIRRYDSEDYPFENVKSIVTEILKCVIADGKGIEVNTSCFRYNIGDLTPCVEILKLYKELGGEYITIGSDSHALGHLGSNILSVQKQLSDLGFKHFYTYDKMQPILHDLPIGVVSGL